MTQSMLVFNDFVTGAKAQQAADSHNLTRLQRKSWRSLQWLRDTDWENSQNWSVIWIDQNENEFFGTILAWQICRAIVKFEQRSDGYITLDLYSDGDPFVIDSVLTDLKSRFPTYEATSDQVSARFWSLGKNGPICIRRDLSVPFWQVIQHNYTANTRAALNQLFEREFDPVVGGKLILWSGPVGTGKTYALRALTNAWRTWADLHYIIDPEAFFGESPAYMMEVLLHDHQDQWPALGGEIYTPRWRLLVLEDTGELLSKDAKERTGQSLSRLLNVCDGLIGQGLRVLVLITTNEELTSLHDAVVRPGRCAANIHFGKLNKAEALEWYHFHGIPKISDGERSLAELYSYLHQSGSPIHNNGKGRKQVGF